MPAEALDTAPHAIVFLDESTAAQFVTAGLMMLPIRCLPDAIERLKQAKTGRGLPDNARIHCRVLFHPDARRKSPFGGLPMESVDELILDCISQLRMLGASYSGAWVDRSKYPRTLRLVEGEEFKVEDKHLAGILSFVGCRAIEGENGLAYRLVYDPDRTKIDWGLVARMQASHFTRIRPNSELPDETTRSLVDIADVVAYSISHAFLARSEPGNRKLRRFSRYAYAIAPTLTELFWSVPETKG